MPYDVLQLWTYSMDFCMFSFVAHMADVGDRADRAA